MIHNRTGHMAIFLLCATVLLDRLIRNRTGHMANFLLCAPVLLNRLIRNRIDHLANFLSDRTKSEEEFSLCRARLKKRLAYSRNGDNGKWKQGVGGREVHFGGRVGVPRLFFVCYG